VSYGCFLFFVVGWTLWGNGKASGVLKGIYLDISVADCCQLSGSSKNMVNVHFRRGEAILQLFSSFLLWAARLFGVTRERNGLGLHFLLKLDLFSASMLL